MGKVLIIGAGGVATVAAHKVAQHPEVFDEIMIASRTKAKCDAIVKAIGNPSIQTAKVDADNVEELVELLNGYKPDMVMNLALPYQDLTIMEACLKAGVNYLDTANYEPKDEAHFEYSWQWAYKKRFEEAGKQIPMLYAANTSKLVNIMNKLLELVTATLKDEIDIEILEMHDQWKKDAPSGTSKEMGEIMAHALGKELSDIAVYGREGESPREPGTIGYHSLRAGNIPSSHTVYFGGMGERLEITHHSYNWECFARGACDCAAYLDGKAPGFYSIKDVLGL